jgi:hypothetical protein
MATPLAVVICNPTVFKAKLWEFWGESMALRGCNPRGYGWKVLEWQLLVGEIYIILYTCRGYCWAKFGNIAIGKSLHTKVFYCSIYIIGVSNLFI